MDTLGVSARGLQLKNFIQGLGSELQQFAPKVKETKAKPPHQKVVKPKQPKEQKQKQKQKQVPSHEQQGGTEQASVALWHSFDRVYAPRVDYFMGPNLLQARCGIQLQCLFLVQHWLTGWYRLVSIGWFPQAQDQSTGEGEDTTKPKKKGNKFADMYKNDAQAKRKAKAKGKGRATTAVSASDDDFHGRAPV